MDLLSPIRHLTFGFVFTLIVGVSLAQQNSAQNPIIHADVPDASIIRVNDTYYMSSTTMHMSPGIPVMKSKDLVNWEIVSYAYDTLADQDNVNMENGMQMYGKGSWASCLRYMDGTYYLSTFSSTTGKTYIFATSDIEKEMWERHTFQPSYHDNSILFDDGKLYMVWGGGEIHIVEIKDDLSGVKPGTERVLIENAHAPIEENIMLPAEGSQLFKVKGKYYLFNIAWPREGMRTVLIHRADNINGPWEGRIALQDKGVAQGGLIDTPDGQWFAYLFRDFGSVGRIPYLVPVTWEEEWPVLGIEGKVPKQLDLPVSKGLIPGIVASDDFKRKKGEPDLPLVWQWNHNPDNEFWTVNGKKGYLRLTTGRVDNSFVHARNTLTQRTIGPESAAITSLDISHMKEGDFAGLALLQQRYGLVGVKYENGSKSIIMLKNESDEDAPTVEEQLPINQNLVYLKAACDFKERKDVANFYYSLDGKSWEKIGSELKMRYTLPHFMGYRFGLFNYATHSAGGYVDFDYFNITDTIN
ncbi:glycoside hydrolase family 43 protein [Fulvivirga lutimaris]|uniref:glycoside hydrolase family 43 protein n=1 Tax=Fulvivirga lutimaris TaxID=1819566 RepID=UPI0012BB67C0|nr:glycoside hydrolase 43 family protein [Fulvivirga lutimaris]MTI40422.1 glycosyl hydrolase 43 family protein [Fulvivirga lutimaris]